jgi:hypothetical protein
MVIVTKRLFIIAEKIQAITIDEQQEEDSAPLKRAVRDPKRRKNKRKKPSSPILTKYVVSIIYTPVAVTGQSRTDTQRMQYLHIR